MNNVNARLRIGYSNLFSIGEFSRISGLSVKTLRYYHEIGLLVPKCVDDQSGYRYYDQANAEKARVVTRLRNLQFGLNEIREILDNFDDDADILDYLTHQKSQIQQKIRHERDVLQSLNEIIKRESEVRMALQQSEFEIEEKTIDPMLIAGVRMKGKYSDIGKGFSKIGRSMGRHIAGKAFSLHYDDEYREDDADFEACMPIRKQVEAEGISVRELPGGRFVTLIHKGPYQEIGPAYGRIMEHMKADGREFHRPTREVYIKGPGMIFKGNPKKYITEIQLQIVE